MVFLLLFIFIIKKYFEVELLRTEKIHTHTVVTEAPSKVRVCKLSQVLNKTFKISLCFTYRKLDVIVNNMFATTLHFYTI